MANTKRTPKPKMCKACGEEYTPRQMGQKACSPRCAIDLVAADNQNKFIRQAKKDRKVAKENTKGYQAKKAQEAFNKFIRLRDKNMPCISCDAPAGSYKLTAGHYRPAGSNPALRFHEDNCHSQCWFNCNKNRSGNLIEYRIRLIKKIGIERVEFLESNHTLNQHRIGDFKAIRHEYNLKCKELEASL